MTADRPKIALHGRPERGPTSVDAVTALSFRPATSDDVDAIVALVQSAYRGDSSRAGWTTEADLLDGQRTDAAAVQSILDAFDRFVLLGYDGDELCSCCELRRRDAGAYFGMFAVNPVLQGAGIGKTVLDEAERQVRALWGATRMEMTVDRKSVV